MNDESSTTIWAEGTTSIYTTSPGTTVMVSVRASIPRLLNALILPKPAVTAVKRPVPSMVPIPPSTYQVSVPRSWTAMPLASKPVAVNTRVESADIVSLYGVISMLTSAPGVTTTGPVVSASPPPSATT